NQRSSPRRGRGLAPHRGDGARSLLPLRVPGDPHADLRHHGALPARDRAGESLTLRPEATAGIVRAVIEHHLYQTDPALKVYAIGPMCRAENVQKGRYRQFNQVDVEVFGVTSPSVDVEVIEMALAYIEGCGITRYELVLNSVGDAKCRPAYVETLRTALRQKAAQMGVDGQRRVGAHALAPGAEGGQDVRGLPAARRAQPPARARLQGARRPGDLRRPAEDLR